MIKQAVFSIFRNSFNNFSFYIILGINLIFIFTRFFLKLKSNKDLVFYKEIIFMFTLFYLSLLFQVVTFQDVSWSTSNFILFKEITRYKLGGRLFFKNIIGNLVMFIPFGFLIPYYFKIKRIFLVFIFSLVTSLTIEFGQLLIGRVFDVDDVLLNVIGGLIGFLVYNLFKVIVNRLPGGLKKERIFNIISVVLVVIGLLYLIF